MNASDSRQGRDCVAACAAHVDQLHTQDLERHIEQLARTDAHAERLAVLDAQQRLGELNAAAIKFAGIS